MNSINEVTPQYERLYGMVLGALITKLPSTFEHDQNDVVKLALSLTDKAYVGLMDKRYNSTATVGTTLTAHYNSVDLSDLHL
jgi:hypothetical protein